MIKLSIIVCNWDIGIPWDNSSCVHSEDPRPVHMRSLIRRIVLIWMNTAWILSYYKERTAKTLIRQHTWAGWPEYSCSKVIFSCCGSNIEFEFESSYSILIRWVFGLPGSSHNVTCLYDVDPLKPHFHKVKLGFTGVYIIFLISVQKHRLWVRIKTASPMRF